MVGKKLYDRTCFVGAVRQTKTVSESYPSVDQAAQSWHHSARTGQDPRLVDGWVTAISLRP